MRFSCPSTGHRDREMPVLGFRWTLLRVWVFEDKCDVCALFDTVQHSNLLFLLWVALHLSSRLPSSTSHLSLSPVGGLRFSLCSVLLTFTWSPLIQLRGESQCCSACSSWISANVAGMLLPSPSCMHPLSFALPPSLPLAHWHVTSSGHSQQHQRLAPTLTSHHFTWAFNSCPNKPDSSTGRRPEKNNKIVSLSHINLYSKTGKRARKGQRGHVSHVTFCTKTFFNEFVFG